MTWKSHLKPEEIERIAELKRLEREGIKERNRIYDRCRKRMLRYSLASTKEQS
jgi:hypothetical protein